MKILLKGELYEKYKTKLTKIYEYNVTPVYHKILKADFTKNI